MNGVITSSPVLVQDYMPDSSLRKVLLFNPPVYDTRFPWSRWQQPITLLQLATLLRRYQCDVRLIDALHVGLNETLPRRRQRAFSRGENSINYWRFGLPSHKLAAQLRAWVKDEWYPDEVYIEGFSTIWWEGVQDAIALVRKYFPHARVILYGAYPTLAFEHAAAHSGADVIVVGYIQGLAGLPLDLSLYPSRPSFTYLSIGTSDRPSSDIIDDLIAKTTSTNGQERTSHFAFADHDVAARFPEQFRDTLQAVIDRKLKVSFYALGNMRPENFIEDPDLATLLFRAGFKEIAFADDRDVLVTEEAREAQLESYQHAIEVCVASGYQPRSEVLSAMICLGRPGEQLEEVGAFLTKLAHVAGSVIVVPYQPSPQECPPDLPLELQNGKLFPFAESNGASYRVYQDFLGLAALLNAKYRSHTFDFMGDGLISRLVRASLISGSWNPRSTPNKMPERPIIVGWFNKEGRWVRS